MEGIMTGRVQAASLDVEQEVEGEEVDQQAPNRPPSHSEALQHIYSLMQFAETNLPHSQPTFKIRKRQNYIHYFTTPK